MVRVEICHKKLLPKTPASMFFAAFSFGRAASRRAIAPYLSGRDNECFFKICRTARPERISAHIPRALRLVSRARNPAIGASPLVSSACAPEVGRTANRNKNYCRKRQPHTFDLHNATHISATTHYPRASNLQANRALCFMKNKVTFGTQSLSRINSFSRCRLNH